MPSKKVKHAGNTSGRARSLSKDWLLELPLDIYWELCNFLDPPDLIQLSKVSKRIRSFLTSTTSAQIWKNSLERFRVLNNLPPYSSSVLSNSQFTKLLFCELCQGCLTKVSRISWPLRARYCQECMEIFTTAKPETIGSAGLKDSSISYHQTIPSLRIYSSSTFKLLVYVADIYGSLEDGWSNRWLVSDLEELSQQLKSVKLPDKRQVILNDWQTFSEEIEKNADVWVTWEIKVDQIEQQRIRAIKEARLNAVIEHLKAIGWEDELHHTDLTWYGPLGQLQQVNQPKELTPQEWAIICSEVIAFMETSRTERLHRERYSTLSRGFSVLKKAFYEFRRPRIARQEICPRLIDVCLEPEVQALLDVTTYNSNQNLHEQLLALFPSICARWRGFIEARLLERTFGCARICRSNNFELASIIFKCTTCGDPLQYPAVLSHGCLNAFLPRSPYSLDSNDYDHMAISIHRRQPFSVSVLDINSWSGISSKLIRLCGLNPKTATFDQMDKTHVRLTCKACKRNGRRTIMTWRAALDHSTTGKCRQQLNLEQTWERVSDVEALKARQQEAIVERRAVAEPAKDNLSVHWMCGYCDDSYRDEVNIKAHSDKQHRIRSPTENDAYFRVSGGPPFVKPILLISDTARLIRPEGVWLSDGRAALHHFEDV